MLPLQAISKLGAFEDGDDGEVLHTADRGVANRRGHLAEVYTAPGAAIRRCINARGAARRQGNLSPDSGDNGKREREDCHKGENGRGSTDYRQW